MLGLTITSPMAVTAPTTMPPVWHFFQYSVSSTAGRLDDAATANASATRCATFWPFAAMPITIAMTPTISEEMRAARTSSPGAARSPLITPTQMSWHIAQADANTRPATTATMVAKATAATKAGNRLPSTESAPPPTCCPSSGPAMLPPASIALILPAPTLIAAPRPRNRVRMEKPAMMPIAHSTEVRASLAVGTVNKRMRICGMPAVPSTSAMPSQIWSIGSFRYRPGSRKR